MGMSTYVQAFKSSAEHDKHVKILKFCRKQKVSLPKETAAYFGNDSEGIDPDDIYDEEIEELLRVDIEVREFSPHESADAYEINVKDLPPEVERIRFCNSW